jgi:hypothetical protein
MLMDQIVVRSGRCLGLAAAISLVVGALGPHHAAACSPGYGGCSVAAVVPADGAAVPANLPALVYAPAGASAMAAITSDGFELLDPAGNRVAVAFERTAPDLGAYYVRPMAVLVEGEVYRIRYPQPACASSAPTAERTFTATKATPTPSSLGTAAMTGHSLQNLTVWTYSGTCSTEILAALAHVTVQPSAELRAYLAMATVQALVDGRSVSMLNYQAPTPNGTIEFDVYGACTAKDPGADRGLGAGKHKVELRAHVAGETIDPLPIWTDIDIDCDAAASGSGCQVVGAQPGQGGVVGLLAVVGLLWRAGRRSAR